MADNSGYPVLQGLDNSNMDIDQALETNVSKPMIPEAGPFKGLYFPQVGDGTPKKKTDVELSDDFVRALKSSSPNVSAKPDISDYTTMPETAVPWGTEKRYGGKYYLGQNNEDIYYNQQGGIERFGKSVANIVPHFTHTLVESVVAPLAGTAYLLDGDKSTGFIDNPFNKWLESWGQGSTLYESSARKDAKWWSPTYWASANSLNSVLGTVGDLAAFYITGKVIAAPLIGAVGRPVGAMLGNSYNKALQGISEFAAIVPEGQEGKVAVQELTNSLNTIKNSGMADAAKMDAFLKMISDASSRYVNRVQTFNKFQQAAIGTITNMGMAQSSAYQSSEGFKQRAIDKIKQEGRTPTAEELAHIDNIAGDIATTTGLVMTTMGAVTLHGLLKGSIAKNEGEQLVRNEINTIEQTGTRQATINGVETEVPQYRVKPSVPYTSASKVGKLGEATWRGVKAAPVFIGKHVYVMPAIGFLEFGLAPASIDSYYNKKYETGDASVIDDALVPNLKNIFTKEGASSFFTGLLAGNLGVGGGIYRKFSQRAEIAGNTKSAIEAMNETYAQSYLKSSISSAKRGDVLRRDYLQAIRGGDKDQELTLRQQQWENYLYPRVKYGMKSFVDKDLQGYRKIAMTDEGIRSLQQDGIIEQGDNMIELRQKFNDHINDLGTYVDNAQKYYDALQLRLGGRTGPDGKPLYNDEHFEKLMVLSGGIDNLNRRLGDLSDDIRTSKLSDDPKFQKRFSDLVNSLHSLNTLDKFTDIGRLPKEAINGIYQDIRRLAMNPSERDELAIKFRDFIKNNIRKKQYIAQYEDIIDTPKAHEDPITQNAVTQTPEFKGETINLVHGNSKTDSEGKPIPSKVEIGTEYYIQNKPETGIYNDKLTTVKDFSKFRIISQEGDNLKIEHDGVTHSVSGDYFRDKKIAKVEDVNKNVPAKFAMDHTGDLFIYSNPKIKLNGQDETLGDIFYEPHSRQLKFRYRGDDGKIKVRDIDIKDTEGDNPKLRFHDSIKKLTPEELKAIKDYRESEIDRMHREKLVKGKLDIIHELVGKKRDKLKAVEDDILDHEIKLESTREQLQKTREQIESGEVRKSVDNKRHFRSLLNTADTLSKTINSLQDHITELTKQSDDLNYQISYLDDVSVHDLPNGKALLDFIDNSRRSLEDIILDTGSKINKIAKFIDSAKQALSDIVDTILGKISLFEKKYLGGEPYNEQTAFKNYADRQLQDSRDNQDLAYMTEGPIISPEFTSDLNNLKKTVTDAEEWEIPVRESEIRTAEGKIDKLYQKFNDLGNEIKVQDGLYNTFTQKLQEFQKEQAKKLLFDTPTQHKVLYGIQYNINRAAFDSKGIDTPEDWQKDYIEKAPKKNIKNINRVFWSSVGITPGPEVQNTPNYQEYNKWSERFATFLKTANAMPTKVPEGYANPDNLRVLMITRKNQSYFFGNDFIKESYTNPYTNETVDNNTDWKKGAVYMVVIEHDQQTDKAYTVNQDGKRLKELKQGEAQDPNNFIFTKLETAATDRQGKWKEKYYIPDGANADQIVKEAEEFRKQLFEDSSSPEPYQFTQSRGIPYTPRYEKGHPQEGRAKELNNSVAKAGLVPSSELDNALKIYTLEDAEGEDKMAIAEHGEVAVKVPAGYPFLKYRNNFMLLNNKKFSVPEQQKLYKVIKAMADNYVKNGGKIDPVYTNYLSGVLYFKVPDTYDDISRNQLWFNDKGELVMGKNQVTVKFHPEDIQADEAKIRAFLEGGATDAGLYHGTSKELLTKGTFTEITDIDKEGNPVTRIWKSYPRYLLSDTYDLANDTSNKKREEQVPLTVNTKNQENAQPWETPVLNRYITLKGARAEQPDVVPEPAKEPEKPQTTTQVKVDSEGFKEFRSAPNSPNVFHYKINGDGTLGIKSVTVNGVDYPTKEFSEQAWPDEEVRKKTMQIVKKAILDYDKTLDKTPEVKPEEKVPEVTITPELPTKSELNDEIAKLREQSDKLPPLSNPFINQREVIAGEQVNQLENIEEVRKFVEDTLPDIKFRDFPELLKRADGGYSWGQYEKQYIRVYQNAPYGTGYHESFHAVRDSFLTDKQWGDIYEEFRARPGTYTDRFGKTRPHANATEQQAEEQMAEEFRQYKIDNQQYTKPSKLTNWFRRLVNFIKQVVLGSPETLQQVFKKMNSSYYRGVQPIIRDSELRNSAMKDIQPEYRKDIIQGIAWKMVYNLRTSYGDLVRMAEGQLSVRDLFKPVMDDLKSYYTDPKRDNGLWAVDRFYRDKYKDSPGTLKELQARTDKAYELWKYTETHPEEVMKDLMSFFRKHRIIFSKVNTPEEVAEVESIADTEVAEQEASDFNITFWDDKSDRSYDRDTFSIDAKKNAPVEIKLLYDFLTRSTNNPNQNSIGDLKYPDEHMSSFMQPELANGKNLWYRTMDSMSGVLGLGTMANKLKILAKKVPDLVRVYTSVFGPQMSLNTAKMQMKFERSFQKQRPSPIYWRVDENNRSFIVDTDFASAAKQVLEQWDSNLKRKSFADYDRTSKSYKVDVDKVKSLPTDNKTAAGFLRELGFSVTDKNFIDIDRSKYNPVQDARELYNLLKKGDSIKTIASFEAAGPVNRLAEAIAQAEGLSNGSQYQNMGGNMVQANVQYNYTGRVIAAINAAGTLDKLYQVFPRLKNDIWSRNTELFKKGGPLYDDQGNLKSPVRITTFLGMDNELDDFSPKTEAVSMNKVTRFMADLNQNLGRRGKMAVNLSINADSNTDWGMMIDHYIHQSDFNNDQYKEKVSGIFKGYLQDEVELIKQNMDSYNSLIDGIQGKRILTENAIKSDNYKKLQVFKDILSPETRDKITDYARGEGDDKDLSVDEFLRRNKGSIDKDLWTFIDKQVDKQRKFLEDYQVLTPTATPGEFKFHKVNSEFVESMGIKAGNSKGDMFMSTEQVNKVLEFRTINNNIHTIELHKLAFGPFYEILDPEKRHKNFNSPADLTHTDGTTAKLNDYFNSHLNFVLPHWSSNEQERISKGVQLLPGEPGYQQFSDQFHAFTYDHDKGIHSRYAEEITEAIGKLGNNYEKVEEADAQGIMSDTAHREYKLKQAGEWTEDHERQHQYDMAAARNAYYTKRFPDKSYRKELKTADDAILEKGNPHLFGTGTVEKPLGAGMMDSPNQGIPVVIKTSTMRLSYPIAEGLGLESMYWWMQDNNIAMVGPKSWQKVGRLYSNEFKGLPDLYTKDDKGVYSFGLDKGQTDNLKVPMMWGDFNKIVETAKSKDGQSKGSQLMSIAIMNSMDNGLPVDFYNSTTDDYRQKADEWNKLTEPQKLKRSDRYRLLRDNMDSLNGIAQDGYKESLKQLGIQETDRAYSFDNPEKVTDFLKQEIERRDIPENIADGLDWKYNPDTDREELYYPLEALPNYQQLRDILWSVVDKNILRPKLNGTNYTLVSSTLFEKNNREGVYKDKDGKYHAVEDYSKLSEAEKKTVKLSSSELQFYKRGEVVDGKRQKTSRMQVKVGNPFRTKLMEWAKKEGREIPSNEGLLKYLKTTEGKKLAQAIGFRVPTQGMNSVDAIEIVGFLPPEMGDAIVVPSEIVTKAGSDFDIDKLGVYHYNFYIDDKGYPHTVNFISDKSDDNLKKLYERTYSKSERDVSGNKLMSQISRKKGIGENTPTLEQYMTDVRDNNRTPYELNSREALENKYFDTLGEILTHPDNYEQLVTPNSTEQMTSIEAGINKLMNPTSTTRDKGDLDFTRLMDPVYMAEQRQLYLEAKRALIGIGAQNNTYHALAQTQYLPLENLADKVTDEDRQYLGDFKIYLPHKQLKDGNKLLTMYSGLKDSVGNFISDKISQYINGAVDAVKDIWLMRLIKSKDLMGTAVFLDRVGVDAKYTMYFINQPAVQEYVKQDTINKAVRGLDTDRSYKFKNDIIALVNTKFSGGVDKGDSMFKFEDLENAIKEVGEGKEVSDPALQRKVLTEFLKYQTYASHSLQDQLGLMYGNMRSPSDKELAIKNGYTDRAVKSSAIGSTQKILDGTFQGTTRDLLNKMTDAMGTILQVPDHPILQSIHDVYTNPEVRMKAVDKVAVLDKADLSLIDYALQNYIRVNGQKLTAMIDELLVNKDSSTATLLDNKRATLKGDIKDILTDSLKELSVSLKYGNVRNIKLWDKPAGAFDADNFTTALRVLRDNPETKELYQKLITIGFLQSGIKDSLISFNKYIPHEDYVQYVKPAIDKLMKDSAQGFEDTAAFYRNNWYDKNVVPKAKNRKLPIDEGTRSQIEPQGIKVGDLLKVHRLTNNRRLPVLKTYDVATAPDGKTRIFTVKLYQKVYNEAGEPLMKGDDYLYKQINAWGDGTNLQEYYDSPRPSVLDKHEKVYELTDGQVQDIVNGGKFTAEISESVKEKQYTTADINNVLKEVGAQRDC